MSQPLLLHYKRSSWSSSSMHSPTDRAQDHGKRRSSLHSIVYTSGTWSAPISALLLLCLLAGFSSARAYPPSRESVTLRANVKTNAEQLVIRLDQYLKRLSLEEWSQSLSASPPSDPMDGLASLVLVLDGYEAVISERLEGLAQVWQEVSSLRGYLEDWRGVHCGGTPRTKRAPQGRLARLQDYKQYPQTVGLEGVVGLKDYLVHLLRHLELLGAC